MYPVYILLSSNNISTQNHRREVKNKHVCKISLIMLILEYNLIKMSNRAVFFFGRSKLFWLVFFVWGVIWGGGGIGGVYCIMEGGGNLNLKFSPSCFSFSSSDSLLQITSARQFGSIAFKGQNVARIQLFLDTELFNSFLNSLIFLLQKS